MQSFNSESEECCSDIYIAKSLSNDDASTSLLTWNKFKWNRILSYVEIFYGKYNLYIALMKIC